MAKKYNVIYANEENGFETEVTEYDTSKEAMAGAKELAEEIGLDEDEYFDESDKSFEGLDGDGYHCYIAVRKEGEETDEAIRKTEELRKEMMEEFDEDWDDE